MKVIVTADIEVHAKCDVSKSEIRRVFNDEDSLSDIFKWIDSETDRVVDFVVEALGIKNVKDNTYYGVYAIKKNIVIKPIEERE